MSRLDPFSWLLPRLFPRGIRVRLSSGATLRMSMDHPFWLKVVRRGYQELATERLLLAGLGPGDTLIDVGAHRGIFTVIGAQRVGERGHVYAFEPSPEHVQGLKTSIRINGLTNVTVEPCAVGEADALGRFVQTRIGYERIPQTLPDRGAARSVPMITLDTYARERGLASVTMIKLDVDGPELMVLRGSRQLLASPAPPLLVVELPRLSGTWGTDHHDVRAYLGPFGYELFACERTRGNVLPLASGSGPPWDLTTTTITLIAAMPALHRAVVDEVLRMQASPSGGDG